MTRTYIIPMRAPSAPRKAGGGGGRKSFMPAEYRDAQRELRQYILEHYSPVQTIQRQRPKAATKSREAIPAWRNVRLDFEVLLADGSLSDVNNIAKWLEDTLAPLDKRHCTREDFEMGWVPFYENDWQIAGGTQFVFNHQPYNELRFTVTELEAALEPGVQQ